MSISVQCPGCEKKLKAKDELVGKRVKCPGCGELLVVPRVPPASLQTSTTSTASRKSAPERSRQPAVPPTPTSDASARLTHIPAGWFAGGLSCFTCHSCGVEAPTRPVAFNLHIGAVVLWYHQELKGNLCKDCIQSTFWKYSIITLLFGWWGLISMFATPFVLVRNVFQYLTSPDLEPVPAGATAPELTPEALNQLKPNLCEILSQINSGQSVQEVTEQSADRAGVTPGQVALYLIRLIGEGKLVADGDAFAAPAIVLTPAQRVTRPAIAILLLGIFNLVSVVFGVLLLIGMLVAEPPGRAADGRGADAKPKASQGDNMMAAYLVGLNVIATSAGVLILVGALKMLKLRSYSWAMVTSILVMIPGISSCCLAGIPVGIWALMVLSNPDVRAAFEQAEQRPSSI